MPEYMVTFAIDIDGKDPQDAAERVKEMILKEPQCVWSWLVENETGIEKVVLA